MGECSRKLCDEKANRLKQELAEAKRTREIIRQKITEDIDKIAVAESSVITKMKKYKESCEKYYHENKKLKRELKDLKEVNVFLHDLVEECVESFSEMSPVWADKMLSKLKESEVAK